MLIHTDDCEYRGTGKKMVYVNMNPLLVLLLLSSGFQIEGKHKSTEYFRLVGGDSRCAGTLEMEHDGEWRPVRNYDLYNASYFCRELGCGAAISMKSQKNSSATSTWLIHPNCGYIEISERMCAESAHSNSSVDLVCSGFKVQGKHRSKEYRYFKLVGGDDRCAGTLEMEHHREWRPVMWSYLTQSTASYFCCALGCGSAISVEPTENTSERPMWETIPDCRYIDISERMCVESSYSKLIVDLVCSGTTISDVSGYDIIRVDPVRLVDGTSRCSGRLEVKSDQSNHQWSSVCEANFDQQDAEVVCRELGCGAPSVLQGALYGEAEAPMWTRAFQCGGNESALLDCRSSDSAGKSCSPAEAVGLTCSELVRLVGGKSRCAGHLEVKHHKWMKVNDLTMEEANVACTKLGCGSALSVGWGKLGKENLGRFVWVSSRDCVQSGSALRECVLTNTIHLHLTCSDSIRLVDGTTRCSGRLEVKSELSNHQWSSVCEANFDQQDAEVVCRELGCGAPSVLQGALYGEAEAPMWTRAFQCGGHESALLDCRSSDSAGKSCSPAEAVGLTCSEPVRLVEGKSFDASHVEVKQGTWKPVSEHSWTMKEPDAACTDLELGSAVRLGRTAASVRRHCITRNLSPFTLNLTCSALLFEPKISASSTTDGVSEAQPQVFWMLKGSNFHISCSIQPQYPGGSFQLTFTSSNSAHNYTQPAVNHSANFLFPDVKPAHQGNYSCVYHIYVFSHNFSSESSLLSVYVLDPTALIIRAVLLLLTLLLVNIGLYFYCKANRGQRPRRQKNTGLGGLNPDSADERPTEEEGAQGAK